MDSSRFNFVLPVTLAVSTFLSASACKDTPSAEASDDSAESTPDYCVDIESMASCDAALGCGWDQQLDVCINTCFMIDDEEECRAIDRCQWNPLSTDGSGSGGTDGSGTEDDGPGACEEPFT